MIAVMAMSALSMSAQDSKFAVGLNTDLGFYSGSYTAFGIGVKLQYNIIENFRSELGYTYYLNKDEYGVWALNANFAYMFPLGEKFKVGPMAGLSVVRTHWGSDLVDTYKAAGIELENTTAVGFNVGAASEYQVSDHFKLGLDAFYKHAKKDGADIACGFVLSLTAAYCF